MFDPTGMDEPVRCSDCSARHSKAANNVYGIMRAAEGRARDKKKIQRHEHQAQDADRPKSPNK